MNMPQMSTLQHREYKKHFNLKYFEVLSTGLLTCCRAVEQRWLITEEESHYHCHQFDCCRHVTSRHFVLFRKEATK